MQYTPDTAEDLAITRRAITREEFLGALSIPPPEWIVELLEMPENGILEMRKDPDYEYYYFIVPGPKYFDMEHSYPGISLWSSGPEWAEYLFGWCEERAGLNVLFLDKRRKIAGEEPIRSLPEGIRWDWFGHSLKRGLAVGEELHDSPKFDHTLFYRGFYDIVTSDPPLFNERPDDRWRRE